MEQKPPFQRYQDFIRSVGDSERMYTLVDEANIWAMANVEGKDVFSLWPNAESALLSASGKWNSFTALEITIEEFENDIIDKISGKGYLINVFSINSRSGFVVSIDEFARDLNNEMRTDH